MSNNSRGLYRSQLTLRHRGFSTIELMVSLIGSSVLVLGLTTSIMFASRSLESPARPVVTQTLVGQSLGELASDIADATRVVVRSGELQLEVPDRNLDAMPESVVYQVGSGGIEQVRNGIESRTLVSNGIGLQVQDSIISGIAQLDWRCVHLEGIASTKADKIEQLSISLPPATREGDLLVCVLAVESKPSLAASLSSGWQLVDAQQGSTQSILVWTRRHSAVSPETIVANWTGKGAALLWVMNFTGAHASPTVSANNHAQGTRDISTEGSEVSAPLLTVASENQLSIQIIATRNDVLPKSSSGLESYANVWKQKQAGLEVWCGVRQLGDIVGTIDSGNTYEFTKDSDYVCVSIALQ